MSARCEPLEQFRWKEGRHWLRLGTDDDYLDTVAFWGQQHWTWGGRQRDPEEVHKSGWRYLAPVATPTEVAALRAEVERLKGALHKIATSDLPDQRADIRLQGYARAALTQEPGDEG
jgi:hypothetical protein